MHETNDQTIDSRVPGSNPGQGGRAGTGRPALLADTPELIEGRSVRLVRLREDMVTERYVSWLNDPETNRFLESRWTTHSLESVRAFVRAQDQDPDVHFFAVIEVATGTHVGNVKLGPVDRNNRRVDLGVLIGEPGARGRGLGPEAIDLATRFALDGIGMHKVTAGALSENRASLRAFEKCGYVVEGRRIEHCRFGDRYMDVIEWARLDSGDGGR